MRKTILAAAALSVACGATFAQSSVTVFGIVDLTLKSVKNGNTTIKQLSNNGYSANQLGFRGIEDLGGGLKAGFWLESAISPDVGTASATTDLSKFWSRRSTVSLIGNFGEIRLGRDLDPSYLNIAFDAFGNLGSGSSLNLISTLGSGATTLVRSDNGVSYLLPAGILGGLYAHVTVAPGEGATGTKYQAARIGYAAGPMNISAAFGNTGTATADDYKIANIGGSYDFGVVKFLGLINEAKYGAKKQTVIGLGALVPVGPQWQIRASAQRVNASGAGTDANDANLLAVGGVYFLSKRTQVYATAAKITNKNGASYAVSSTPAGSLAMGSTSTGLDFGLRHSF
ncbi:porin [Roseateles sp. GG27B]